MHPEDVDLDAPDCLMANLFLVSSSIDPFGAGDLDDALMPRSSSAVGGSFASVVCGHSGSFVASSACAASYHQSGELGAVPLEDVEGDDYLSD